MSRAVVHKTKGKLDLRSLTVFGLNAKPSTDTPIGYFGTGLKYAVAVLARNNIPITLWIDGKKWTVEQDDTKFRDKSFRALFLKRHTFIPKTINLPFTTELGKNWELWQVFRELEANTRDEKGMTYVENPDENYDWINNSGPSTFIVVESEEYVQEYLDKDKTFLPDGLTARDSTERIQVFARKSHIVYYRGIRILDLKEPSENTYNILSPIALTEDRTCKSEFDVRWEIEHFIAGTENEEVIRRAITAPQKSFERKLDYDYTVRSDKFLDTASSVGEDATENVKSILRRDRPPQRPTETYANWIRDLIAAVSRGDFDRIRELGEDHRDEMMQILEQAAEAKEKEDADDSQEFNTEVRAGLREYHSSEDLEGRHPEQDAQQAPEPIFFAPTASTYTDEEARRAKDDDIPF